MCNPTRTNRNQSSEERIDTTNADANVIVEQQQEEGNLVEEEEEQQQQQDDEDDEVEPNFGQDNNNNNTVRLSGGLLSVTDFERNCQDNPRAFVHYFLQCWQEDKSTIQRFQNIIQGLNKENGKLRRKYIAAKIRRRQVVDYYLRCWKEDKNTIQLLNEENRQLRRINREETAKRMEQQRYNTEAQEEKELQHQKQVKLEEKNTQLEEENKHLKEILEGKLELRQSMENIITIDGPSSKNSTNNNVSTELSVSDTVSSNRTPSIGSDETTWQLAYSQDRKNQHKMERAHSF